MSLEDGGGLFECVAHKFRPRWEASGNPEVWLWYCTVVSHAWFTSFSAPIAIVGAGQSCSDVRKISSKLHCFHLMSFESMGLGHQYYRFEWRLRLGFISKFAGSEKFSSSQDGHTGGVGIWNTCHCLPSTHFHPLSFLHVSCFPPPEIRTESATGYSANRSPIAAYQSMTSLPLAMASTSSFNLHLARI